MRSINLGLTTDRWVVSEFDRGRIVNWKNGGPRRIFGHVQIFWLSIL